jgi:hypothetical protein
VSGGSLADDVYTSMLLCIQSAAVLMASSPTSSRSVARSIAGFHFKRTLAGRCGSRLAVGHQLPIFPDL